MPAKGEFLIQPEIGALGLRETRRSDSVVCRGAAGTVGRAANRFRGASGNGALRSARGNGCENTNPNIGTGANGRRSPRLASCQGNRTVYPYVGAPQRTLSDITNVSTGCSSHIEKVKPVKRQQSLNSFQPPSSFVATESSSLTADVPKAAGHAAPEVAAGHKDDAEGANAQTVQEYASDINIRLFQDENDFLPHADYMDMQTDITAKMRTILIDWLIEVHMKYRLRPETLHLTVNLIDRYLSKKSVMRKRLQLVGVVAMFIASKFEEITPPELHDWVYITDNAYSKDDVLVMECDMLTILQFRIVVPTAAHFFSIIEKVNGCDAAHRDLAQYLLELGLLDVRVLKYTPSQTVCAALLLSNELIRRNKPSWPATMAQAARGLTEENLRECVGILRELLEADQANGGGQLQAVHKKFSVSQRNSVSKMKF